MQLAIKLAKRGEGKVYTNPLVGCVIVKNSRVVGKGWHKCFGGNHAEVNAIIDAGGNAYGSDMYVTLEPCNSYGKRPPCTLAIIKSGVKRVYYAIPDSNVSGSKEMLERYGVEVYSGILKKQAKELLKDYLKYLRSKPKVSVKAAMTLDGKIATCEYDSKWITSEKSRNFVHKMRAKYDAVLVGTMTAIKDNPYLDAHSKKLKSPLRVVIDSKLKVPESHHLFDASVPTIVIYDLSISDIPEYLNREGIILVPVDIALAKRKFSVIIEKLKSLSIRRVLIEGGSEVIASALFSKTVNDIYFFIAPKIVGGKNAVPVVGGMGVKKILNSLIVKHMKARKIGRDLLITGTLN
jgi:diaminohydroxyphosphoribosylaminopyrimidine deaminase/5-amino-6-(5-phosphoribosylamino)uracil reductase